MTFLLQIQIEAEKLSDINQKKIEEVSGGVVMSANPLKPPPQSQVTGTSPIAKVFQTTQTVPTPVLNG